MSLSEERIYTIYAGVNGAGKSTIYKIMNPVSKEKRVNSDEILLSNGGDWRNEHDQWKAMKEAVVRINSYINEGISFNQETTLAGRTIIGVIQKAKKQGFYVRMYYVGLENADLAVERVSQRVKKGGHGIDETVIRRRYDVSLETLKEVIPLCDLVMIYDNTESFRKIAKYEENKWFVYDDQCDWVRRVLTDYWGMY